MFGYNESLLFTPPLEAEEGEISHSDSDDEDAVNHEDLEKLGRFLSTQPLNPNIPAPPPHSSKILIFSRQYCSTCLLLTNKSNKLGCTCTVMSPFGSFV